VFPDVPTTVIRNAVLPEVAGAAAPGGELRTVGYLGALDRIKGVHLLLEAAPALARLGIRLRLAGDGRLREEVEAAAAAHENVEYAGRVGGEAKQAFLAAADVGIVPSVWEEPGGPTLTMVEWLAAGRPVLVSPRGGLGEVVDAYPGARACEPETDAIVAALDRLRVAELWREAVAAVVPPLAEGARRRWVEAYTAVYASLAGASVGA
jgi:glycosyltransferase involved in cell wall biosynthesis